MFSYASGHKVWKVYGAAKDHSLYLFSVGLRPNLMRTNFPESFPEGNILKKKTFLLSGAALNR